MTEDWKPVKHSGERYMISSLGRVKNAQTKQYLKPFFIRSGQRNPAISLAIDKKAHTFSLAKLVAETFLGSPPQGTRIGFKDGDKTNCRRGNLHYVAYKPELIKEGIKMNLQDTAKAIWKELIPDTQMLLKKHNILAESEIKGEFGLHSRWTAEKPEYDG